jgi:hypothetical protein
MPMEWTVYRSLITVGQLSGLPLIKEYARQSADIELGVHVGASLVFSS